VCHRATAGDWIRGVLEQYVAGSDTRGRPEGRSYPWSQQAIREISGLDQIEHDIRGKRTESRLNLPFSIRRDEGDLF